MKILKPCACGEIPEELCIYAVSGECAKWAFVHGSCCGEWNIEFRTGYSETDSEECRDRALHAWNYAPRKY